MNKERERLLQIVENFPGKRIAIWGDFILDEYLYGNTRRISREAPVLILAYKNKEYFLGGAGNALLNLRALGACPFPIGIIGEDESGEKILHILKQKKINTDYLIVEKNYETPLKTRILAGEETTRKQQILRIDHESIVPDNKTLKTKLQKNLENIINQIDALLISDYNYFTVKEDILKNILPELKKMNIPITLDSRFRLLHFKELSAITPNEPEVEHALNIGLNDNIKLLKEAGKLLLNKTKSETILITRGAKGMILFERGKTPFIIKIHGSSDIVDVTGAGDTVISVFTLSLASGSTFREAAKISNYAGSIVVMKKGTSSLTLEELKETIIQ